MSLVVNPYSYFTDTNGNALSGYLYVGEVGKNAENYPIAIFYDALFTTPAPNPLTISAGYIYNSGTIAQIYASVNYSIVVKKTDGSLVYSSLNETGMTNGAIANIDEMKDFVAPYNNYALNVLGNITEGDGEGGAFYYDANSTATADDINIIEPTSGSGRWIRVIPLYTQAYTIETVDDFDSIPSGYITAIVKDIDRGGIFIWESSGTANDGTVFAGSSGYWVRQYSGAVNVRWFGAKGDYNFNTKTGTDDTAIFQAIIASYTDIYIPNGNYLFSSGKIGTLCENSSFIGENRQLTRFVITERENTAPDTTSAVNAKSNSFLSIGYKTTIKNIGFDYPNNFSPTSVLQYPITIYMEGYYATVTDIDLYNSYFGMFISAGAFTLSNIIGLPLNHGINVYECHDIPSITNIHFNKNIDFVGNGDTTKRLSTTVDDYVAANGVAYKFGRVDFTDFQGLFAFGYNKGIYAKTSVAGALNNARFINCNFDICSQPFVLDNWQDNVSFIGCTFTSLSTSNSYNTVSGGTFPDILSFKDCRFDTYGGSVLNLSNGAYLKVNIESCTFQDYNLLNGGYRVIYNTSNIYLNIDKCTISSTAVTNNDCDFVYVPSGTGTVVVKNSIFDRGSNNGTLIKGGDTEIIAYDNIHISGNGNSYNNSLSYARMGSIRYGAQVPTSGTWNQSDIVFNSNAVANGNIGWVCTVGGTPGTWKTFGTIQA